MHLQADVFTRSEGATHTAQCEANLVGCQAEARGDLSTVFVEPLRGDEQLDSAAARVWERQRGFQAEERLVLHAQLVGALDDDIAHQRLVAGDDPLVTDDVAGNSATGIINPGSVVNPSALTGHNYSITFSVSSGATTYAVVDTTSSTTLLSAQPYSAGGSIRFDGMDIVVEGAPANGDKFTVAPSTNQSIFKTVQDLVNLLQSPLSAPGDSARLSNGLKQGLTNLDQALGSVLTQRGVIGAKLNEIDALQSTGNNRSVQYQQTLSRLQNVDLNAAISDLTQQQLSLQAAQKSFVQVSGLSLFSYL